MKKPIVQYHFIFAISIFCSTIIKAQALIASPAEKHVSCDNMSSFEAKAQNKSIVLTWRTLSEFDDQYFNVQRSKDGINWDYIGKIKGTGGSLWPVTYCYVDTSIDNAAYFYRIKTIDGDYFIYSSIATV